jgi:hypothetical protein
VRTRIAPVVFPKVVALEPVHELIFRMVSQIALNYRGMPLSAGSAGRIHGGDRLPWAPSDNEDNFSSLSAMIWQIHVYGSAGVDLVAWCADHGMPQHVFEWKPEYEAVGLARNAHYLIRPDSYVGLADASGDPKSLDRYFAACEMQIARRHVER